MSWRNPRWNSLTGADAETLRAIFKSLEDFLTRPSFEQGMNIGQQGSTPTYDPVLDVTVPPPTEPLDSTTFDALDAALGSLQTELDAVEAEVAGILPITETEIADDAISTPKLQANAITAEKILAGAVSTAKLAAGAVTAEKILAGTITANELAADSVTAEKLAAIELEVGKYLRSTSYTPGVDGFTFEADGSAELNDVVVRGDVHATRFIALQGLTNHAGPGTFEAGTESWVAGTAASTVSQSSTQAHGGTFSLRIVKSAVFSNLDARTPPFAVTGGRAYRCSLWIFQPAAIDVGPTVAWYDDTDTLISSHPFSSPSYLPSAWAEHKSNILIAPNNAAFARVWVRENIASATGGTAYVDDVQFRDAPLVESGAFLSDSAERRIQIVSNDLIEFHFPDSTDGNEAGLSRLIWSEGGAAEQHAVRVSSGAYLGQNKARVVLTSEAKDGSTASSAVLEADEAYLGHSLNRIYPVPNLRARLVTVTRSIPHNTSTTMLYNVADADTDSGYEPATGIYTVPFDGLYLIAATLRYATNAVGVRQCAIRINGGAAIVNQDNAWAAGQTIMNAFWVDFLAAGSQVTVSAFQTSGGALNVEPSASAGSNFRVVRLGA